MNHRVPEIAVLASANHIPVAPQRNVFIGRASLASTPKTLLMETYPAVESRDKFALPSFSVKDGVINAPQKPGIGIDPAPDIIEKYRVA